MKAQRIIGAVLAVTAVAALATSYPAAAAPARPLTAEQARSLASSAAAFQSRHPEDFAGLAELIEAGGGRNVRFTYPKVGAVNATGIETQRAYERAVSRTPSFALPTDIFTVGGYFFGYGDRTQGGAGVVFTGTWNYRDNYIGSGGPANASGVATADFDKTCWKHLGDMFESYTWNGTETSYGDTPPSLGWREQIDFDKSVWAVRDRTSNFELQTDNGSHTIAYEFIGTLAACESKKPYAKYYFEHNQGDDSPWSASISIPFFSLSYGGPKPEKLQKSTPLIYLPKLTDMIG